MGDRVVTTDEVIQETATLLQRHLRKGVAVRFRDAIEASERRGETVVIRVDEDMKKEAWDVFSGYTDKDFSFCDCTSFVVMKRYQFTQAFAFDDHFRQSGFVELRPGYSGRMQE